MLTVDCCYTLSSPWACVAGPRLGEIARRHHARIVLEPCDFQDVVPRTGGIPILSRPQPRQRYPAVELKRWARYLGMPLDVLDGELFWGQDRLGFLDRALAMARRGRAAP